MDSDTLGSHAVSPPSVRLHCVKSTQVSEVVTASGIASTRKSISTTSTPAEAGTAVAFSAPRLHRRSVECQSRCCYFAARRTAHSNSDYRKQNMSTARRSSTAHTLPSCKPRSSRTSQQVESMHKSTACIRLPHVSNSPRQQHSSHNRSTMYTT